MKCKIKESCILGKTYLVAMTSSYFKDKSKRKKHKKEKKQKKSKKEKKVPIETV